MTQALPSISTDQPLEAATALDADKLDRVGFAGSVASALRKVSSQNGFVVSIEGAWGSGKTSILALVEALLTNTSGKRPIVVRFNPWLVGDRDALLRHFLVTIASSIQMSDKSQDAARVGKELTTYAKVFDLVKLVPGAEPWASLLKSVIEAAGNATETLAEHKAPDLEEHKKKVENALRAYERPVVVFVDDIDRLFPQEVFEMIRIIKAVGELPNVGYLLAWDAAYVRASLETLRIPKPDTYLDKIVQVRMPLPSLSKSAREQLMNDALTQLPPEALKSHFPSDGERLRELYFSGLRELLEQPRDFNRLFNTVGLLEPRLRGEIVFADIVGYSALLLKAPDIAQLLRRHPRYFVGKLPDDTDVFKKGSESIQEGASARSFAYGSCDNPNAVKNVVHFLFPVVEGSEEEIGVACGKNFEGHIASPTRLLIALQLSISPSDVSLVNTREFLSSPSERALIVKSLTEQNCVDFLESLADLGNNIGKRLVTDLAPLCLAIAEFADSQQCAMRVKNRRGVFNLAPDVSARHTISEIVEAVDYVRGPEVAAAIVREKRALSVAAGILVSSYLKARRADVVLIAATELKGELCCTFADNVKEAAVDGFLMECARPAYVLWILSQVAKPTCPQVFSALRDRDTSLDLFACEILKDSFDSVKGQTFALHRDIVSAFVPVEDLKQHANQRLTDPNLNFPARAAWQTVISGKRLYALDGTDVD